MKTPEPFDFLRNPNEILHRDAQIIINATKEHKERIANTTAINVLEVE